MSKKNLLIFLLVFFCLSDFSYGRTKAPFPGVPPMIGKVAILPENPGEGEDVKVTATIYSDEKRTDDTVLCAVLRYSIDDGKAWEEIDLEQDEQDKKIWRAIIPAQKKGTKVLFYISASDTNGNIATETSPLLQIESPEETKDVWKIDENSLVLVAEDEKEKFTDEDLDIRKIYFGSDDEYLYFKLVFEGNITLEKPTATGGFYCLHLWKEVDDLYEVPHTFLYYRQSAPVWNLKAAGVVYTRNWNYVTANELQQAKELETRVDKNVFYWKVKKSYLEDCPENILKVSFWTGSGEFERSVVKFWPREERVNYSPVASIYFRWHSYLAGE
ncbi:MAG: hypothetical protein COS84_02330 [Armatimonadetes bacterium CG07_land_8_20_14_0_80_40_9]|nr:MAG: hypothetical protein COS84_02330 [Armatimonadetes bacterium CG07_land_8_20_14_0_80_40_9]